MRKEMTPFQPKRWIKSPNGNQPADAPKEFLLPEGEGQDEGEGRLIIEDHS